MRVVQLEGEGRLAAVHRTGEEHELRHPRILPGGYSGRTGRALTYDAGTATRPVPLLQELRMTSVPTRPTIGPEAGTALPAVSERFLGVASSVVRDLLALTQRPGVISFAGGLPAPELFDTAGLAAAFAAALADGGRTLQYS